MIRMYSTNDFSLPVETLDACVRYSAEPGLGERENHVLVHPHPALSNGRPSMLTSHSSDQPSPGSSTRENPPQWLHMHD